MAEKMRIHFIFDPDKDHDGPFGRKLVEDFGQTPIDVADTVVTIGGDGMLMHALHRSAGKKVAGLVSPGSSSVGFWTNKGISSAGDLTDLLNNAASYSIKLS